MPGADFLSTLIEQATAWVRGERDRKGSAGHPLTAEERTHYRAWFPSDLLASVRIVSVDAIPEPPFYDSLRAAGIPNLIPFEAFAGITFGNCILLSRRFCRDEEERRSVLFHELVHVAQYRKLGVTGFMERYLTGWVENGFTYRAIPLEVEAYRLQKRYDGGGEAFSVLELLDGK